jgi:hypothetical protein
MKLAQLRTRQLGRAPRHRLRPLGTCASPAHRHGNVFRALHTVDDITADLETLHPNGERTELLKAVHEFDS